MTRKPTQSDYDSVFESGRSRSRAKSVRTEPAAPSQDIADFVEEQVQQITNAVRLAASGGAGEVQRESVPTRCEFCEHTDESHLHGAKLFVAGKEIF